MFGWIWDTVEYNDVTLPENLLRKGKEYLSSVINTSITIELSAVDLHHLNCNIEKFKKGDLVRVISIPHKLDRYFLVSKLSLSLDDPKQSKLTLGQTFETLTQNQVDENKEIKNTVDNINLDNTIVKKNVENLRNDVTSINNIIVDIPSTYVDTGAFNKYKEEVNKKLGRVYTVKGSVSNYVALGNLQNNQIGDVYNVLSSGANYVYTEDGWDKLSETIDLSSYLTVEEANEKYVAIVMLENFYYKEHIDANFTNKADFEVIVNRVNALEGGNINE